ncbi:MAG: DUF2809 domain-containing protein [Pseudomonadota bacterium]
MPGLWPYRLKYLAAAGVLFVVLILIERFASGLMRTHGGDVFVVAWLYALLRTVLIFSPHMTAMIVVALAFAIELGQAFSLIERLGLGGSDAAALALGRQFDPYDLLAYVLGGAGAYTADWLAIGRHHRR